MTTAARVIDRPDQAQKRLERARPILLGAEQQADQVTNL
jgi:hypothetical protein